MDPRQILELLEIYLASMWKYRWIGLAFAWIVASAGLVGIYLIPHQYQAEAQVYVDTDSILRPLLGNLSVQSDVQNDLAVITKTMLSRAHLERVVRAMDMDLAVTSDMEFEGLLRELERRIRVTPNRGNLYSIRFVDTDRQNAVKVVSELLNSFVERTLGTDLEDSRQASLTLRSQIEDYEGRLLESEKRLEEFKRRNVGLLGNQNANYYQQLQTALAEQKDVQQKVRVAKRRFDALTRQLEGEEPVFGIMAQGFGFNSSTASPFDTQIAELETRITDLLLEYTENHPEVVRAEQRKLDLQREREAFLKSAPQTAPINPQTGSLDLNPIYQNIRIQLSNVEVDLASLMAQQNEKDAEVNRLQDLVDVIPQVEAELSRMNRDYGVVKSRYEQMLERWETLQTGNRVRSETAGFQFRIIDPPYADEKPAGPPKTLFSFAVIALAILGGVTIAFGLTLVKPVFVMTPQLDALSYPVVGAVSALQSGSEVVSARWSNLLFLLGLVALIGTAFAYMALLQLGVSIAPNVP